MDSLQKYLSKAPELCFSNTKYENLSNILGLYFYCAFKLQRLITSQTGSNGGTLTIQGVN